MLQCPVWEEVVRIKSFIPFLSLFKRLNLVQPRSKLKHSLELADLNPWESDRIDLLIGADLYAQLLKPEICPGPRGDLVAQSTIFGWILSGPLQGSPLQSYHINVHFSMETRVDESLRQFWELKEIPAVNLMTKKEIECEHHFMETHSRDLNGKYVVQLPFDDSPSKLGDSYNIALNSLCRIEKRFTRDPLLAENYRDFLGKYQEMEHMTPADVDQTDSSRVFIPHHPVVRESSQTTKVRVVFNASSPTSNKTSINNILHIGPKLQTDICSIIL
ncbi:uncharacterized protein LOC127285357 [Leptopilina boulardi]|uniref:uncharacterized protein LOC127285357 n=1 Tax=Leptopilina boulardi TaxID=63433 RepID=UPI0021F62928|nr:uncharacterized protein LOC127285357 [Leptopilina boulardi]